MLSRKQIWPFAYSVHQQGNLGPSPDMNEKFVSAFQGIICKKDLPPFTKKVGYIL